MKEFKGIWIPYEILTDTKLNDKENECIMSNAYISKLLDITKIQASRIVNSLEKKGYIKIQMIYKENSKEIALRKITPINKYVNTNKQICNKPINKNVKEIININKINYKKKSKYKSDRDYSDFNGRVYTQ